MDPALQELISEGAPDDEVAVLLKLSNSAAVLTDVRLVAQFGNIASCRLRRGDITTVRLSAPVLSMKAARSYTSSMIEDHSIEDNESLPNSVQDSDIRRPITPGLSTGKGVVVAHIDWGIDIAHPDFRLPDGSTRLLALWDQRGAAFPDRPNRYGYGRIFDRDEINQALRSDDPYSALSYDPADFDTLRGTHGTHTLSISAGNGRGGGPSGIAPDADLIFVHLSTYTAEGPTNLGDSVAYFEAIDFVLRSELPLRPVVINSSLGRHGGPHVGTTLIEQGLDVALRESPGRAFVHSTGNYYNRRTHASGTLRPGETHTLQMQVMTDGKNGERTLSPSEVEIWYPGTDRLAIGITVPNGNRFELVRGDRQISLRLQLPGEPHEIGRLYHRLNDPNNGDNEAVLFLYKGSPTGVYEITLFGEDIADGRYHLWIERNANGRRAQSEFEASDSRVQCTTGTICNGFRTIAVGAYDAHAWYQNGDVPETGRPLAPFSSSGPTRDGRQKPDLCAPGVQVLAARSCPRNWVGKTEGMDPPLLTRMSGTSMAAPHVTGTIALMFEAVGHLLPIEETRRLLLLNTDPVPAGASDAIRARIGSGFLNIEAVIAAARLPDKSKQKNHSLINQSVLLSKETLHPMNPSNETNEFETDSGYCPDHDLETDESNDIEASQDDRQQLRRDRVSGRGKTDSPSIGFVLPLGGGGIVPALSFPVGGKRSPFSVTVPLTSPTPTPAIPAATQPTPTAPTPTAPTLTAPPAVSTPTAPTSTAPTPVADPYASPADPWLPAVSTTTEPVFQPTMLTVDMPYVPVIVADTTVTDITATSLNPDAEDFVAAGSDKSIHPSIYSMVEWQQSDEVFSEQTDNPAIEGHELLGEKIVSVADALAEDPRSRTFQSSTLLATLLDAVGQSQKLSPLGRMSGHFPSATELYNAFVHSNTAPLSRHRLRDHYANCFVPIALPGDRLQSRDLCLGDIVVRVARGENWGQFSIVSAPSLLSSSELGHLPLGHYVSVIECSPRPRLRRDHFFRRVTDTQGKILPDTLVLRVQHSLDGGRNVAPRMQTVFKIPPMQSPLMNNIGEWEESITHPLLRRGARGADVREAQTKLNIVHNRNVSMGLPGLQSAPLTVDGAFGQLTYNAVVSFQQQAFPGEAREWDGVIGAKTWAKLDAATTAIIPVVPIVPVPTDRQLSRAEVMRWFTGGMDTQGQPMGRVTSNNQVSYLIRGRRTFDAMMRAMRTANAPGHFIYLLGWWLSDDFPVSGGLTMRQVFTSASQAGVTVRAMLWDQVGTQNSNEVDRINALPNGAAILDNRTLNFGSHHQKILIVNGSEGLYAFCGGVDINPDRISPAATSTSSSGGAGTPMHDVHCQIQGPAALDLLQIFQQRWIDHPDHADLDRRIGSSLPVVSSPVSLPNGREWIQIGRTFGNGNAHRGIDSDTLATRARGYTFLRGRAGEQTVKRMILHAISQARQFIYLEDQYLVSLEIRDALIRALPNIQHLTILIPDGSISDLPQGNFRRREFIAPLRAVGGNKVRVFHPHPVRAPFGYVHSKTWVFDDEYAIIGSANCNRRGYTHDSEVIAGICGEGSGSDLRFAHRLRMDLWALHLNMNPASLIDGVASAAYWLRSIGSGRIERHDENVGIDRVNTDVTWNDAIDPNGS